MEKLDDALVIRDLLFVTLPWGEPFGNGKLATQTRIITGSASGPVAVTLMIEQSLGVLLNGIQKEVEIYF